MGQVCSSHDLCETPVENDTLLSCNTHDPISVRQSTALLPHGGSAMRTSLLVDVTVAQRTAQRIKDFVLCVVPHL